MNMLRPHMICYLLAILLSSTLAFAQKDAPKNQEADSLAKLLFGEEKTEEQASVLFERGKEDFNAGEEFLKEANAMRAAGTDTTMKARGGVFGLIGQAMGDTTKSSKEQDTRKRATSAFKDAAKNFERAQAKQPEFKEVELWLVATYDRLEEWDK